VLLYPGRRVPPLPVESIRKAVRFKRLKAM
jgi:hypothetical protein